MQWALINKSRAIPISVSLSFWVQLMTLIRLKRVLKTLNRVVPLLSTLVRLRASLRSVVWPTGPCTLMELLCLPGTLFWTHLWRDLSPTWERHQPSQSMRAGDTSSSLSKFKLKKRVNSSRKTHQLWIDTALCLKCLWRMRMAESSNPNCMSMFAQKSKFTQVTSSQQSLWMKTKAFFT